MNVAREDIIARLRPSVEKQLTCVERQTGLQVRFSRLPTTSHVAATYTFNPHDNVATVGLASKWKDVDVAHELLHMQLELVEGFSVLAWRRNVAITDALNAAMQKLRTLPDDEVVHERLVAAGFQLDGEVLKPQIFDDRCKTVPKRLRSAYSLKNDGMAHLDPFEFGDYYRASLYVQVQLIRDKYSEMLFAERLTVLDDFLESFRRFRPRQHRKANRILQLFQEYNVQTIDGHSQILVQLTQLEKLVQDMGISSYSKQNGKYILPWP